MPSASDRMATPLTKGVLISVRRASFTLVMSTALASESHQATSKLKTGAHLCVEWRRAREAARKKRASGTPEGLRLEYRAGGNRVARWRASSALLLVSSVAPPRGHA